MRSRLFIFSSLLHVVALGGCDSPPATVDSGLPIHDGDVWDAFVPRDGAPDPDSGPTADSGGEPCASPGATESVACGMCGTTTRFCSAALVWEYGPCSGETGECAPGETRASACGNCGSQVERCSATCGWELTGACASEGECAPGASTRSSVGCAAGETREVLCNDACTYAPAGACENDTCPSPGAIERVTCGPRCGSADRFCTSEGVWSYGPCAGEGECAPGSLEAVPCGACGTVSARCTTECVWETTGACTGEGECAPGTTSRSTESCPPGQSSLLTCSDACVFEPGACSTEECTPGAVESVACGRCGTRTRTCDAAGRWAEGACTGEGTCEPGTTGTQACGLCGTQPTRCTAACVTESYGSCTGEITCPPPPATRCLDATTLRAYSPTPTCAAGVCSYAPSDVTCSRGCTAGACAGVLINTLGGPVGFGTDALPVSDDGSSAAISLETPFPVGLELYGARRTTLFVNNNGNLSFGAALTTYTPAFPRPAGAAAVIAPWWGDVDTRGDGRPAKNNVYWFVDGTRFVATWHLVGYYSTHDDLQNSFQVILTSRSDVAPGDFDAELRYESCQWTTGDASGGTAGLGGTPASAGFDAGNGIDFRELPGSGTATVLDLCTGSNIGVPGIWRYQFRAGRPL